jgi:Cytochrome c7 and related cytochrome c
MSARGRLPSWALALLCAIAFATQLLFGNVSTARDAKAPSATPAASAPILHGLAPLPGGVPVPLYDRPPGAFADDGGPSPVIFPAQKLTIRFNHRKHVRELGLSCTTCHDKAKTSRSSRDSLIPTPIRCDGCHDTDHRDLNAVKADPSELISQCGFCHVGYRASDGNRVARMLIPRPNLRFSHELHLRHNIGCQQCHGNVQNIELATRDQLPRMRGCFHCHQMPVSSRGKARGACPTCHLTRPGGGIRTRFASGELTPPHWLGNAAHGPDWITRHKLVAGIDSSLCANCHKENYCVGCHDGRVRPRQVHPNDWLSMHPIAAREDNPHCQSCHREQSFCISCHQRAGITLSGPYGNFANRGRFHPPKAIWTDPPRGPDHHSWAAERNLNACLSCHTEHDCVTCHATRDVGGRGIGVGSPGQGVNPHPADFMSRCAHALRENARPCLVCHDPADPKLEACR